MIPYTLKIRSGCEGGGKCALIQTDMSATLATNNDQYLFQPVRAAGFKAGNGPKAHGIGYEEEIAPTLSAAPSGTNQAPSVCIKAQYLFENHSQDTRYKAPLDVSPMLPTQLGTGGNNTPFVVEENASVICLQGNGIDRADTAGCNGKGWKEDVSYTLNTIDRPAVVYALSSKQQSLVSTEDCANTLGANDYKEPQAVVFAMQAIGEYKESEVSGSLKQRDYKDATDLVCGIDCRNMNESPELYPTLQAKPNGGQSLNFSHAVRIYYIVRRLTPTECARLQGFPDWWDADADGSDSARYKMWGNGIALPCAEFVLRRIAEFVRIERMGW